MSNLFLVFSLVFVALLGACRPGDERRDIRDYYFPLRGLTDGLVYEYRPVGNDSLPPAYRYYRSILQDTAMFLTANYYTGRFEPQQLVREELVDGGMVVRELFLYAQDSAGLQQQVRADVQNGSVFPFYLRPGKPGVYLYKVRFRLPSQPPGASTTLILNRQFAADTTFTFEGKNHDALLFHLRGVAEIRDTVAGGVEPEFGGAEIYAEGLGLVEYWRDLGTTRVHYRLAERYPMARLEEKARQELQ